MEDLIPDLSAPEAGGSLSKNWSGLLTKKTKKKTEVSDRLVFNDVGRAKEVTVLTGEKRGISSPSPSFFLPSSIRQLVPSLTSGSLSAPAFNGLCVHCLV